MVHRAEEREHSLFSRVRNAEYARQKQEQSVRKAQQELYEIKRQNAQKIKEEMSQLTKQEQELEQKLLREQAQLAKVSFVMVVFTKVRSMFSHAYDYSGVGYPGHWIRHVVGYPQTWDLDTLHPSTGI